VAILDSTVGGINPETFPYHQAVHEDAKVHGLTYAWEGTPAFEERLRMLSPEQHQILAVHPQERMTRVMLFQAWCVIGHRWPTVSQFHQLQAESGEIASRRSRT
jgi:hypothetical protein